MMLAVALSASSMGALGQWSADIIKHTHIDIVKDPACLRMIAEISQGPKGSESLL